MISETGLTLNNIPRGPELTARSVGMVLGVGLAGAILTTFVGHEILAHNPAFYKAIQISFIITSGFALLGALASQVQQTDKKR